MQLKSTLTIVLIVTCLLVLDSVSMVDGTMVNNNQPKVVRKLAQHKEPSIKYMGNPNSGRFSARAIVESLKKKHEQKQ